MPETRRLTYMALAARASHYAVEASAGGVRSDRGATSPDRRPGGHEDAHRIRPSPSSSPTPETCAPGSRPTTTKADVVWVGYYKKATKLPSVTVAESVDVALCFGWIDGLKRSVDDKAYKIRFTPRAGAEPVEPPQTWPA